MLASAVRDRLVTSAADEFAALTERHLDGAYRLATVILGDAMEAEDAVHDAAIAAWRGWSSLRDPDRFEAWFSRIVVNGCRDRLRARRRRPIVELTPERGGEVVGRDRPDGIESLAARDALARAFEVLDPEERIVIALRFWRDLTVDDIAERTATPSGTVKSRLHHALGRLRTALTIAENDR
jgi:RNA polymerase sigma-70 factor (ECF subfamily)